ncbi:MAG: metallophosphoesterase family protein [Candidatus Geothermincolia bacterium]
MAVKIISDIHGAYGLLRGQLEPEDIAVLLGDYLNLIDFRTLEGILAQVYSRDEVERALALMASKDKDEARRQIREVIGGTPEKGERMRELVMESYREFFESIPCKCFMLYGNTDSPEALCALSRGRIELVESGIVNVAGQRFGMVSGAPHGPWNVGLPGEMPTDRYDSLVASLGPADVLCTHYPPAISDLTWDTLAKRDEVGSPSTLAYIEEYAPAYHYFGHVHNPRASSVEHGCTSVVNVGHFRELGLAIVHPA